MGRRAAIALIQLAAIAGTARAEEPRAFVSRPAIEWAVAVAGGAVWLTETLLIAEVAPARCRWCASNAVDDWAGGLAWTDREVARVSSDVLSYGVAPLATGGLLALDAVRDGRAADLPTDLVIVAEATIAAGVSGDLIRVLTGRERPWVHRLPEEEKATTPRPEQNNLSFISGHTATAFALAVSSGTVASRRGRRLAPVIWATGLTVGAVSGYLRVASEQHYLTDVIAGIGSGVAIGLAVPALHRAGGERATAAIAPTPGGALLLVTLR